MTAIVAPGRGALAAIALIAGCAGYGTVVAVRPAVAAAGLFVSLLLALAFVAPVAHLLLLIVLSIVPYAVQNAYSVGVAAGSPGLIGVDVLLITGLVRAGVVLLRRPLQRRELVAVVGVAAFLALALLQSVHGYLAGHDVSAVGAELRVLLGFGTFLVALPVVRDHGARAGLLKGLVVVGLLLGAWGLLQWVGAIPESETGDFGIREAVDDTTEGQGSLQGGLYLFPVAMVIGFAALISRWVPSRSARLALLAVVALNGVSLLLTYERTFWLVAVAAGVVVAFRAGRLERVRALVWSLGLAGGLLVLLAVIAPTELAGARERFLSLGQYSSDNSVRARVEESRHVLEKIETRPLVGSGLGDTIYWGQTWLNVPPGFKTYSESGYLWLMWKVGIPAALLLFALMGAAIWWRGPPVGDSLLGAVRNGAQGGLLLLLLGSITFAPQNSISVTPTTGLLLAFAVVPAAVSRRRS